MSYEDQLRKLGGEIDQRFFILQQRHEQQLQDILRSSQRDVELYKQRLEQEIQQRSVDINKIGDLKKEVDTINEQNKSLTKLNNTLNTTCEAQKNVIIDLKTTLNDTQKKLSDKNTSVSTIEELNTLSMKTCTAGDMTHDENNKEIIKTDEKKDENINERALEYVLQQQSSLLFYFLQENPSISTSTSILQAALQVDASVADGEDDDMSSLILSFASIEHLRKVLLNACKAGDGQLVDVCIRSVSRMFVRDVYDNDGSSLLLNSCIGGCVRTCELLLKLTTIPHTPNNQLMTPLHVACQRGDSKVVETLLSAGSDSKSVDARGRMARDIAIEYENNEILDQIDNQEVINVSSMGNECYKQGDYKSACVRYGEAISICESLCSRSGSDGHHENLTKLHYNKARACFRMGEWLDAISECDKCLKHDSLYENAFSQRAQCHTSLLRWEDAATDYARLMEFNPSETEWIARWHDCHRQSSLDHYSTLQVQRCSSVDEIKKAFRKLVLKWHPDKNRNCSKDIQMRTHTQFSRIQTAYSCLVDEKSKRQYDLQLSVMPNTHTHTHTHTHTQMRIQRTYVHRLMFI
eukprot:GHVR01184411.1.p1 GENE.GHVR01184411.1~~GHVR01184411.1.p1  ORF type:complete len:579 (-),score=157.34 GHVR01184411.1:105-1841(-)